MALVKVPFRQLQIQRRAQRNFLVKRKLRCQIGILVNQHHLQLLTCKAWTEPAVFKENASHELQVEIDIFPKFREIFRSKALFRRFYRND